MVIVTGRLAEEHVKRHAEASPVDVEVLALPVAVAALLSPPRIALELQRRNLQGTQLILVPGLVKGDVSMVSEATGIPTVKGPKYCADLPLVLGLLNHVHLSSLQAADDVVATYLRHRVQGDVEVTQGSRRRLLRRPGNLLIGGVAAGKGFPLRVMAEILDVPRLSDAEIRARAAHYVASGADIIDVGMMVGASHPDDAARGVTVVKDAFDHPVSVDTCQVEEARAAVEAGADMVLSVDGGTIEEVAAFASEIPVVVIPTIQQQAGVPETATARVEALEANVRHARACGLRKVVGDLVLNPLTTPGLMESLMAYHEFARRNPGIPLLFGAGNVTELLDADSVGVNALLAGVAAEVKASIVLTTEGSAKTQGSVRELAVASTMMWLAAKRRSVPKDLGLDLLVLKNKRREDSTYDRRLERDARTLDAGQQEEGEAEDPAGGFRILIDREAGKLVAIHHRTERGDTVIKGGSADALCAAIIRERLVSTLTHASYLGRELAKAETALRTGKNYVQDEPVFPFLREVGT